MPNMGGCQNSHDRFSRSVDNFTSSRTFTVGRAWLGVADTNVYLHSRSWHGRVRTQSAPSSIELQITVKIVNYKHCIWIQTFSAASRTIDSIEYRHLVFHNVHFNFARTLLNCTYTQVKPQTQIVYAQEWLLIIGRKLTETYLAGTSMDGGEVSSYNALLPLATG